MCQCQAIIELHEVSCGWTSWHELQLSKQLTPRSGWRVLSDNKAVKICQCVNRTWVVEWMRVRVSVWVLSRFLMTSISVHIFCFLALFCCLQLTFIVWVKGHTHLLKLLSKVLQQNLPSTVHLTPRYQTHWDCNSNYHHFHSNRCVAKPPENSTWWASVISQPLAASPLLTSGTNYSWSFVIAP